MATLSLERGVLDLDTGVLTAGDEVVVFTEIERRLLAWMAARPGVAVARDELQEAVWGYRPGILSRTVFTTVGRVRAKLELDPAAPRHLVTVPGQGYALHPAPTPKRPESRAVVRPLGELIGREREVATLRAALASGARVVTVHGPGGVGKTRLALEVASGHADGATVVWLEGRRSAAELPAALATALGLEPGRGPDPLGELVADVGSVRHLVVWDNAEHLAPGVAALTERLVAGCPGVQVLVTSRRRLGVVGEHVLRVEDLGLPDDGRTLAASDAGRLLLLAASRARLGWEPGDADREALARICHRVGGSPLALELAASWLRLLEPLELEAELERGDEVLVADDAGRPARHRSVADTLAASWRLLDVAASDALERLAMFSGPFDRGLAEAVGGAGLMVLGQLVDAAMLLRHREGFDLHPLVRRDALRRLRAAPERERAASARHAEVIRARVARAAEAGGAWTELASLRAELLAVWRRAVAAPEGPPAWLAELLAPVEALLTTSELIDLLGEAVRTLEAAGEPGEAWASALRLLGVGAGGPVPIDLEAELIRARRVGARVAVWAGAHAAIGSHHRGCPEDGLRWALDAASRADAARLPPSVRMFPRGVAGSLLLRLGRLEEAREVLTQAISMVDHGVGRWRSLVHLGQVELALGEAARARGTLVDAIVELRRAGDVTFAVMGLTSLAAAEAACGGDPSPLLHEAVDEATRCRLPPAWTAGARAQLAAAMVDAGEAEEAALQLAAVERGWLVVPRDREAFDRVAERLRARR